MANKTDSVLKIYLLAYVNSPESSNVGLFDVVSKIWFQHTIDRVVDSDGCMVGPIKNTRIYGTPELTQKLRDFARDVGYVRHAIPEPDGHLCLFENGEWKKLFAEALEYNFNKWYTLYATNIYHGELEELSKDDVVALLMA